VDPEEVEGDGRGELGSAGLYIEEVEERHMGRGGEVTSGERAVTGSGGA
jgi:hypothetical protein